MQINMKRKRDELDGDKIYFNEELGISVIKSFNKYIETATSDNTITSRSMFTNCTLTLHIQAVLQSHVLVIKGSVKICKAAPVSWPLFAVPLKLDRFNEGTNLLAISWK